MKAHLKMENDIFNFLYEKDFFEDFIFMKYSMFNLMVEIFLIVQYKFMILMSKLNKI